MKIMSNNLMIHLETITQNILGLLVGFTILHLWGLPIGESVALQAVFFVVSYLRSYLVRSFFSKYNG